VKPETTKSKFVQWGSWIALATVFSIACWFLSQWQFQRQKEVVAANNIIIANYDSKPVPLDSVLKQNQQWRKTLEFKPVSISGSYIPFDEYLVRNRPNNGSPGFLQLVAFKTVSNTIIWVDRGWLPTGNTTDTPDVIPQLDSKPRTIVLRLRANEVPNGRTAPLRELPNIDLPLASKDILTKNVYLQAYGRLVSETSPLPRGADLGKPDLTEGNHLSYALQWLAFALMAFGAVFWNISQDRRRRAGLSGRKLKILTKDKDGEIEDELLDGNSKKE